MRQLFTEAVMIVLAWVSVILLAMNIRLVEKVYDMSDCFAVPRMVVFYDVCTIPMVMGALTVLTVSFLVKAAQVMVLWFKGIEIVE